MDNNDKKLLEKEENTKKEKKRIDWKFFTSLGVSAIAIAFSIAALCKNVTPVQETNPIEESQKVHNAFEMAKLFGYTGTEQEWNESIDGKDGKSAYELAVEKGYAGSENDWIASLKGENGQNGKSAYEIAKAGGYSGSETEWLASLVGQTGGTGKSAYQIAVDGGFTGTESEWLASLRGETGGAGKSAYEIAVDGGFTGTEAEWIESLNGSNGQNGKSIFVEFYDTFEKINTKLTEINKETYKTPYDRFSQLDFDIEETFIEYKVFANYFYYSLKDNQFVLYDLNDYILNGKSTIYNTTSSSYRKGNNFPTSKVDLFKFVYSKQAPSTAYSNYLTSDYTPTSVVNDYSSTGLRGSPINISTGLDVGAHENTFIIVYNRSTATSGQEVTIRSPFVNPDDYAPAVPPENKGSLMINAEKDTIYYYGSAKLFSNISYPLNYNKLIMNNVEVPKE